MKGKLLLITLIVLLTGCKDDVAEPCQADGCAEAKVDVHADLKIEPGEITGDLAGDTGALPPPETLWPAGPDNPAWSDWVKSKPWLTDVSTWSFRLEHGPDDPVNRYLPDYGVGNGHVFCLAGYTYPFNTLHSMSGPYYHKGEGFFGDTWLTLSLGTDAAPAQWKTEWVGRPRRTAVLQTVATHPYVNLVTVDFAPRPDDIGAPERRSLLRAIVVQNRTQKPLEDVWLTVHFSRVQEPVDGAFLETREERSRLTYFLGENQGEIQGQTLRLPVGELPPVGEKLVVLAYVLDDDAGRRQETVAALEAADVDDLLEQTRASWHAQLDRSTDLVTPDPRVNDYVEGQKVIVLAQIAYNGGSHAMCEYTGTWLRDHAGPMRLFTRCGLFEEARAMLDYLWLGALVEGTIKNSYFGDFQPDDAKEEPDWSSMPTLSGRPRAESPSYLALMYTWYARVSGKLDFLPERAEMLRAALEKQAFEGDLLPFSTDETFRTAMAAAHGLSIFEQFEEGFFSANSSFLWVAAAQGLAGILVEAGVDVGALLTKADTVRAAAEETFLVDDGYYAPYVYSADLAHAPAPFEDVNTKLIWTGFLNPLDARAVENLASTIELLDGEDGILVSEFPDAIFDRFNIGIEEGMYTGMSPGYYLFNLAAARHPLVEKGFNALAKHATASGSAPEMEILDDFTPLHLVYDPDGAIGDYTARYRPWEGGILGDSVYEYLLGNQSDAGTMTLHLAPNLPNGWSWLEANGLRVADTRVDLRIEIVEDTWTIVLTHKEGETVTIDLALPAVSDAPTSTLNGESLELAVEALPWDNAVARLTAFELASGQTKKVAFLP